MSAKTSVIIPNYNGIGYLDGCLQAMERQTVRPDDVIVVDNGSSDGSADFVRRHYPWVHLIELPENTGFTGAVNTGIRASGSMDYVILLNNDTRAFPDFAGELIRAMEKRSDIFSCQAKMLSMSDPRRIDDAGDLYCALGWAFARGRGKSAECFRHPAEIFSCCAGAAIYRMSILKEIGLFDENHFAYLEDTDIGWRARIRGYRNVYIPAAKVLHMGSASSGSRYNLFKIRHSSRNSIYVIAKNMPAAQILMNLPFLVTGFFIKFVFFSAKGYGKEYLNGLAAGFQLSRREKSRGKTPPSGAEYRRNYRKIEREILRNVLERLMEF